MSAVNYKRFILAFTVAVVTPLVIGLAVVIIVFAVLPNAFDKKSLVGSGNAQIGDSGNDVIFCLGIILASGLIVFLIVVIIAVCVWARQGESYGIHQNSDYEASEVNLKSSGAPCQLTGITSQKESTLSPTYPGSTTVLKKEPGKERRSHGKFTRDPSINGTPYTVGHFEELTEQKSPGLKRGPFKETEEGLLREEYLKARQLREAIQGARPQSYGTRDRTRLLSSVDEDGFYVDKFSFDFGDEGLDGPDLLAEINKEIDKKQAPSPDDGSGQSNFSPLSISTQKTQKDQESSLVRQSSVLSRHDSVLSHQDSLEPIEIKPFENYLSLVPIDSPTSLSPPVDAGKEDIVLQKK